MDNKQSFFVHEKVVANTTIQNHSSVKLEDKDFLRNKQDIDQYIINNEIELLIFDCDGTLIDTLGHHWAAWDETFSIHNYKFITKTDFMQHFAGTSGPELIEQLNVIHGYDMDESILIPFKNNLFIDKYLPKAKPIEIVLELANYYHAKGLKIVVASGGHSLAVKALLANNNLDGLFHDIVTIEDVKNGKPSPDIFITAAKRQNILNEKCIVFEDAEAGFIAAKLASMDIVDIHTLL